MLEIPESELIESVRDAILIGRGIPTEGEAHYLSELFTDHTDPYRRMCESICQTAHVDVDFAGRTKIIERAIQTSHFSTIAAQAGNLAARVRANSALEDIRPMVAEVALNDYRPVEYPILETQEIDGLGQPEGRKIPLLMVTATGEELQVEESVQNLIFSRQLLANNDFDVILRSGEAAAAAASRQLGVKFASLLENNSTLSDGVALFHSDQGNLRTDGGLNLANLDLASDALRKISTTDGTGYTNGRPRFLLVPSSEEQTARVLVSSINSWQPSEEHLRVVALPWLSSTYWYLIADPAQAPAIAMAVLAGGNGDIVQFEELPKSAYRHYSGDGSGFRVRTTVGMAAVSRNIIRNTLA